MVNYTLRPLYPREKDPVPILQKAGWAPGPVWRGAENLAPAGIQFQDRPARSAVAIPTALRNVLAVSKGKLRCMWINSKDTPAVLPGDKPLYTGNCEGPRVIVDGFVEGKISCPHRSSNPEPFSLNRVAIRST